MKRTSPQLSSPCSVSEVAPVEPVDDADQPEARGVRLQPAHVHDAADIAVGHLVERPPAGLHFGAQGGDVGRHRVDDRVIGRRLAVEGFQIVLAIDGENAGEAKTPGIEGGEHRRIVDDGHRTLGARHLRHQERHKTAGNSSAKRWLIAAIPLAAVDQLAQHRHQRQRQILGDQPGTEAAARLGMDPHRRTGSLERRHALRQQPGDDARQHVARPSGGEPRRAIGVDRRPAIGRRDHRVGALVDDDRIGTRGSRARLGRAWTGFCPRRCPGTSRPNSPSCGVITSAGRCRPARRFEQRIRLHREMR